MSRRLAEVARKVGVSEATVSRVLNGKPGVSDSTREAVLTALDVLGYERPTKLRGERARLVGLVLPELQNPIFPAFAEVVGGALAQQGFTPVLCTQTAGGVSEADYVELLLGSRSRASCSPAATTRSATRRTATTSGSRGATCRSCSSTPRSRSCRSRGSRATTRWPSSRRSGTWPRSATPTIGLVLGPVDHVPSERKLRAAQAITQRLGPGARSRTRWSAAPTRWRAARPRATGCCARASPASSARATRSRSASIRAARRAGLRVPDDISVVGYDDSAFMSCTEPPLTTVRQPIEPMGRAAIDLLVSQIHGGAVPQDELLFEPELVVRGSTGPAPAQPAAVAD